MFKKINDWYDGLTSDQRDRFHSCLGVITVAAVFVIVALMGIYENKGEQIQPAEGKVLPSSLDEHRAIGGYIAYADTVFAVAVHTGNTMKSSHTYREIIFSHGLYLYCCERSGMVRHYDYNDPVYVEPGDICEVWVEIDGDKQTVVLIENFTKRELANLSLFLEFPLVDYD